MGGLFSAVAGASKPAVYNSKLSALRDFLDPGKIDRVFVIDNENGFRSWTLEGSELSRFLGVRFGDLEDPLCIRRLVLSAEHQSRTAAGIRLEALAVSEFLVDGEIARVDLLPKYPLKENQSTEGLAPIPLYQCVAKRAPSDPR